MQQRNPKFSEALFTILGLAVIMFSAIVIFKAPPHIPMLLGCVIASIIALKAGYKWKDIEQGMVNGIIQALRSLIILMLIGVLIGIWIAAGVVPSMIYYGLELLSPKLFLVTTMLICSTISLAIGSWGTAGTIGLAFMGIAQALNIPAPIAAGAIISGCYFGDQISPISDTANLSSAVTGVDIFKYVRHMAPVSGIAYTASAAVYIILGLQYGKGTASLENVNILMEGLKTQFCISPLLFLPLAVLVGCILFKVPAIPGITIGILVAGIQAIIFQGADIAQIFNSAYYGFISKTGNVLIDGLLSAGGLEAMMYSVSMILTAMMFGGIMEHTGQMEALMTPVLKKIRRPGTLISSTVISCAAVNLILPEQYISIAIPGRMYIDEYKKRGIDPANLARALGAGGAMTSSLVPWNTCGVFMMSVLGVSASSYAQWAFLNILTPVVVIVLGFVRRKNYTIDAGI